MTISIDKEKRWPDDYRSWEGSFDELVSTAQSVLASVAPDTRPLTARLVRHYQAKGAVSRGLRSGRTSRFAYPDLAALVATKNLVKGGWTLDNSATLMDGLPADAMAALTASPSAPSVAPASSPTPDAVQLVRQMLQDGGHGVAASHAFQGNIGTLVGGVTPTFGGCASAAEAPADCSFAPPAARAVTPLLKGLTRVSYRARSAVGWPGTTGKAGPFDSPHRLERTATPSSPVEWNPESTPDVASPSPVACPMPASTPPVRTTTAIAPWLTLDLDETACQAASPFDRAAAAQALETWARRLRR